MDPSTEEKLLFALESGDFQTAIQILPKGDSSQLTLGPEQLTPLHYACQHGEVGIARQLITEYNYSIKSRSLSGQTPLYIAAKYGQLDVLKVLVSLTTDVSLPASKHAQGASTFNTSVEDHNGDTPLHIAAANGHPALVQWLISVTQCKPSHTNYEGQTPLHLAAKHGHVNVVQHLINEEGCPTSPIDGHGRTPLYLAAGNGQLEVVQYLVEEKECDPSCGTTKRWETKDFDFAPGRTPLHTASQEGHLNVVQYLVREHKCDSSCRDKDDNTPIHLASLKGHLRVVQYLISEHDPSAVKRILQMTSCTGNTPLHYAAYGGSLAVVKFFINEKQCNPMSRGRWGRTPLHHASQEGHPQLANYLIDECHTDPSCQDGDGTTPLHLASKNGHMETVKFFTEGKGSDPLFRDKYGNTSLHAAALGGSLNVIKFFINEKQCNPMSRGRWGRTPLHHASQEGHPQLANYLIDECHTDPSCQDGDGTTPLHLASKNGHMETVKFFTEEKGCNPLFRNNYGNNSLHSAALGGSLAVIKFFINEKKCNPMSRGLLGRTPLHDASQEGHLQLVKYLIDECHTDPSCQDEDGVTPLHLASSNGHVETVKFYTEEKGCNPLFRDKYGNTSLHEAALGGSLNVIKFFLNEKQSNRMSRDQWGRTPLHHASQEGHLQLAKYLIDECHTDPSCQDENGVTPLHLASLYGHMETVKFFTEEKRCHPALRNKYGATPLDWACEEGEADVALYLIGRGASLKDERGKAWVPLSPLVKIYIVGNSGSGKTTLAKALQDEDSWIVGRFRNVRGITPETAGIIATKFQSITFGKVTLYDFAGHEEYFASHEAIFGSTSHAVVLITVDLTASTEEIQRVFGYWQFMTANALSSANCHAHIIVVGTHSDFPNAQDIQTITSKVMKFSSPSLHYTDCTSLDARKSYSAGMTKLRQLLQKSCRTLRGQFQLDHRNGGLLYVFITQQLRGNVRAYTFTELLQSLLNESRPQLEPLKSPPVLYEACETLNRSGHLLFLRNKETLEESWLILDQRAILSQVHGILKHIKPFTHNTGLVPLSLLESILNEYARALHPDLAIQYMLQMEFCKEIDPEALKLITSTSSSLLSEGEKYLFFPDLISAERPNDVWTSSSQFTYTSGWCLKCTEPYHFFTPRFLQVLLIHLACKFALHPHPTTPVLLEPAQGCRLWKNGIRWLDAEGVETVIELTDQNTVVTVLMRSLEHGYLKHCELRSSVIGQVLSIQDTFCHAIKPKECLLLPDSIHEFPTLELPLVQVTKAILKKDPYITLDDETFSVIPGYPFLPMDSNVLACIDYEPYKYLEAKHITKLFADQAAKEPVQIVDIAACFRKKWKLLAKILNTPPTLIEELEQDSSRSDLEKCTKVLTSWSARDQRTPSSSSDATTPPGGSYASLRCALDKYSMFAGRNPLDLCPELKGLCPELKGLSQSSPERDNSTRTAATASPQDDISSSGEEELLNERVSLVKLLKFPGTRGDINIPQKISTHYTQFGIMLLNDHSGAIIRAIAHQHTNNAVQINTEIFQEWLAGKGKEPVTWRTLINVLCDIGLSDLAGEVKGGLLKRTSAQS